MGNIITFERCIKIENKVLKIKPGFMIRKLTLHYPLDYL